MIYAVNIHRITKYFLFTVLILFHLCFAQEERELNEENLSWKPPRRLLYSGESSGTSNAQFALYFLGCTLVLILCFVCQYCLRHGCQPMEYDFENSMTPRRGRMSRLRSRLSRRRTRNPPSIPSSSNILPSEADSLSRAQRGIENPNYNYSIQTSAYNYPQPSAPQVPYIEPRIADPSPSMDLPPSYEAVVNAQQYPIPKSTGSNEKRPLKC